MSSALETIIVPPPMTAPPPIALSGIELAACSEYVASEKTRYAIHRALICADGTIATDGLSLVRVRTPGRRVEGAYQYSVDTGEMHYQDDVDSPSPVDSERWPPYEMVMPKNGDFLSAPLTVDSVCLHWALQGLKRWAKTDSKNETTLCVLSHESGYLVLSVNTSAGVAQIRIRTMEEQPPHEEAVPKKLCLESFIGDIAFLYKACTPERRRNGQGWNATEHHLTMGTNILISCEGKSSTPILLQWRNMQDVTIEIVRSPWAV